MLNPDQLSFDSLPLTANVTEFIGLVPDKNRQRVCSSCGISKPISAFYANTNPKYPCRDCNSIRSREWAENNKALLPSRHLIVADKKCQVCNRILPLSSFSKASRCKSGYLARCKECAGKQARASYSKEARRERYISDELFRARFIIHSSNKSAIKHGLTERITVEEWLELKRSYGNKCAYCGIDDGAFKLGPDHLQPLARGGRNSIDNIVPSCTFCNFAKQDYSLLVFLGWKHGMLQ